MKNVFVDSNILLYCFDPRDDVKGAKALKLFHDNIDNLVISSQVLQEFYSVAVRKLRVSPARARNFVELLCGKKVILPDCHLVLGAIDTSERYQLSFWDSLIIEAAVFAGCTTLYSEDLNPGQVIRGVKVVNPFV